MPVNAIRLERLALLLVLVSVGLVSKLVVLIRALALGAEGAGGDFAFAAARTSGRLSRNLHRLSCT